jgi:hypothetical protein
MLTTVDGREFGSFSERWKNSEIQFSPGGFLGVGIDFKMVGQSTVMVMVGFEFLPLKKIADGKNNYSGFLIHLSFNRRAK